MLGSISYRVIAEPVCEENSIFWNFSNFGSSIIRPSPSTADLSTTITLALGCDPPSWCAKRLLGPYIFIHTKWVQFGFGCKGVAHPYKPSCLPASVQCGLGSSHLWQYYCMYKASTLFLCFFWTMMYLHTAFKIYVQTGHSYAMDMCYGTVFGG